MGKLSDKIANAAHIKQHTKGTSNEISFSVLHAASSSLDEDKGKTAKTPHLPGLGVISLFTLGKAKKPAATPTKEHGLHLPSGEFVSLEEGSGAPALGPGRSSGTPETVKPVASQASPTDSASTSSLGAVVPAGGSDVSSLSGPSSSWTTPVDEVARRKSARRRNKALAIAALSIMAIAALVVGVQALSSVLEEQKSVRDRLITAISDVEEADETLVVFDELVVSMINDTEGELDTSELETQYAAIRSDLDVAYNKLVEAKSLIERLQQDLTNNQDLEASNQAIASINARMNMIDSGRLIAENTIAGRKAIDFTTLAWDELLQGDSLSREAASMVTNTTVENVGASKAKSTEALALFRSSYENMVAAQDAFADLDITGFINYVDLRIRAQECAIASDQAYLDRNKELAASKNDEYNNLDKQAAELAQGFEEEPADIARALMDSLLAGEVEAYASERGLAGNADTILRGYLGTKNK